jgi:hypothetical protein
MPPPFVAAAYMPEERWAKIASWRPIAAFIRDATLLTLGAGVVTRADASAFTANEAEGT